MLPLCFPPLTFNKFHLHTHVLHGFFPAGHKEFGSRLITDCTRAVNTDILRTHFLEGAEI
jgi:hypothetical protein